MFNVGWRCCATAWVWRERKTRSSIGFGGDPEPAFTSARLRFDRWRPEDFELLYELHSDSRVQTGFASGPEAWTKDGIRKRLDDYIAEQERFGITKWKLSLLDGTFIGRGGWSP